MSRASGPGKHCEGWGEPRLGSRAGSPDSHFLATSEAGCFGICGTGSHAWITYGLRTGATLSWKTSGKSEMGELWSKYLSCDFMAVSTCGGCWVAKPVPGRTSTR